MVLDFYAFVFCDRILKSNSCEMDSFPDSSTTSQLSFHHVSLLLLTKPISTISIKYVFNSIELRTRKKFDCSETTVYVRSIL